MLDEASSQERAFVEQWLSESGENKKYYDDFKFIWDASKKLEIPNKVNEEEVWQRFQQKVNSTKEKNRRISFSFIAQHWQKMAAVGVILIVGIWVYFTRYGSSNDAIVLKTEEKVKTATLPDGSKITLNKNTTLTYEGDKKSNQRAIIMEQGEAFFDVKPNKQKPFVVETQNITITVVGTSFNVKNTNSVTEIIVESGIVRVSSCGSEVELHAKEKAIIRQDRIFKESNNDELYRFYRSRELIASSTPLSRVAELLSEAYGKQIVLEDEELSQLELTASFKNASLNIILDVIGETFDLEVENQDNKIILRRKE
jgi:ferric-dicitrate binding protein FerR (iron transport regulator)